MVHERSRKILEHVYRFGEAVPRLMKALRDLSEAKQLEAVQFILEVARQDQERGSDCTAFFRSLLDSGIVNYLIPKIAGSGSEQLSTLCAELLAEFSAVATLGLQEFFSRHQSLAKQLLDLLSVTVNDPIAFSVLATFLSLMNTTDKVPYSPLWDCVIAHAARGLEAGLSYQYKPFCLDLLTALIPTHGQRLQQVMAREQLLNRVAEAMLYGPKHVKLSALKFVKGVVGMRERPVGDIVKASKVMRAVLVVISKVNKHGMLLEIFRAMVKDLKVRNEVLVLESLAEEGRDLPLNFQLLPELREVWDGRREKETSPQRKRPAHEEVRAKCHDRCFEGLGMRALKKMKHTRLIPESNM